MKNDKDLTDNFLVDLFIKYYFHRILNKLEGTVHEKPFFPGKCGLGPNKYESGKEIRIKIKQPAEKWQ